MPSPRHRIVRALRLVAIGTVIALTVLPAAPAAGAVAFVQTLGTNAVTTTGTTTVVTVPAGGVPAGNTVIVAFAMDPVLGTPSCADSQGNTYTRDADIANGVIVTGVRTVVFSAPVTFALVEGDTITVSHNSVAPRAMSAHVFSGVLTVGGRDRAATATGNSTTPSSGNTATTTQGDELLIGAIGVETKLGGAETFAPGAGYTALASASTPGGALPANNITVNAEFQIVTATGAFAADGTLGVARPWAAAIVTYRSRCGNGVIDGGEQCDDGNTQPNDCCSPSCEFEPPATVCRPAVAACDAPETCTGSSVVCPADAKSTGVCRPSATACDAVETCDGLSNDCPADAFAPAGTECRASAGACDPAETCTGGGATCPADIFSQAGTECRASAGVCDLPESCTGASAACPADGKSTAVCRGGAGICDVPESCNGVTNDCPADGFVQAGTQCRGSAGVCDPAETCTGTGPTCPADGKSTAVCRASTDLCDAAESCNGVGNDCPADGLSQAGTQCRASAGGCDPAETCTGATAACPPDTLRPNGFECRGSAGSCDVPEACDGSSAACPADAVQPSTLECRPAAGACDQPESCTGTTATCPTDVKRTDECRPASGVCDAAESCDGSGNDCPADAFQPTSFECRPAAAACDAAERCTGTGTACPTDTLAPAGTECRAASGTCDVAETCSGASSACPADGIAPDGTPCDDGNVCTTSDTCSAGLCQGPADPYACADDFLCYKTKASGYAPVRTITLVDAFETSMVDLPKAKSLCAPAGEGGEGVLDPATYPMAYQMKPLPGSPKHIPHTNVRLRNQLGDLSVDTIRPDLLLVPAAVDATTSPPPLDPQAHVVNHFKCYTIKVTRGTPKFRRGARMALADTFSSTKTFELMRPRHLCLPVDQNGGGMKNPDAHLICYQAKPAKGQPKHVKRNGVRVNDELGPLMVSTVTEAEVCLPSLRLP